MKFLQNLFHFSLDILPNCFHDFAHCQLPDGTARNDDGQPLFLPEEEAQETLPHGDITAAHDSTCHRFF